MAQQPDRQDHPIDIEAVNERLAEWAARSATASETLIDRFEAMGYAVRGESEDEIAEVLRRPPNRPGR